MFPFRPHRTIPLLVGLALLATLASPCGAAEITVTKAAFKFNPKKTDSFVLAGTFTDFALLDTDEITIRIGDTFTQTIPLAQFVISGDKVAFKAAKGTPGISAITLNLAKSTFSIGAKSVALAGIPYPAPIAVAVGDTEACRMIALVPKLKKGELASLAFSGKKHAQFPCLIPGAPDATPNAIFVNAPTTVRIEAKVVADAGLDPTSVKLWRVDAATTPVGAPLDALFDDGSLAHDDEVQGDGVFTNTHTFTEAAPGPVYLQVTADLLVNGTPVTLRSPVFTVDVVQKLSAAEIETIRTTQDLAGDAVEAAEAELGRTLKARKAAVKAIKKLPGVVAAGLSSDLFTIWIKYQGGPVGALALNPETETPTPLAPAAELAVSRVAAAVGAAADSSPRGSVRQNAEATKTKDIGNNRVMFWEPFADQFPTNGSFVSKVAGAFEDSTCPRFLEITSLQNTACTVASVKAFPKHGTVVVTGHGGVVNGQVIFLTRDQPNYSQWWNNDPGDSRLVLAKARFGDTGLFKKTFFGITPAFITSLPKFETSFVFNAACDGLDNDTMKDALHGNGVGAYVAIKGLGAYPTSLQAAKELFTAMVVDKKTTGEAFDGLSNPGSFAGGIFDIPTEDRDFVYSGRFRNGDFETGDLAGWKVEGDGRVVTSFGSFHSRPPGINTALVSTGLGRTTTAGEISQEFCLPKDATKVDFEWNFSSEEFVEYCSRSFQDSFKVELIGDIAGSTTLFSRTIDELCSDVAAGIGAPPMDASKAPCTPTDNVGFGTGGNDCKVHSTNWRSASLDIATFATSNDGKGATLRFSTTDVGDSAYDTAVLVDNVKIVTP